jgi:hypothetical protein
MLSAELQDPVDMLMDILQGMSLAFSVPALAHEKLRMQADADRAAMADTCLQWLSMAGYGLDSVQAFVRCWFSADTVPWS